MHREMNESFCHLMDLEYIAYLESFFYAAHHSTCKGFSLLSISPWYTNGLFIPALLISIHTIPSFSLL